MRRTLVLIGGLFVLAVAALFGFLLYVLLASGDPTYWAGDIDAFERRDVSNPPPKGAVLFLGDDDVRQWTTLGGAQIAHITYYIPRIVVPYRPRAIVMMAGASDMSGAHERRPEEVLDDVRNFVESLRKARVNAPVYFVSIHPQPLRQSRWLGAKRANALIEAFTKTDKSLHYVDVASPMLNGAGEAKDELFNWDGLLLDAEGQALVTGIIKARLLEDGYGPQAAPAQSQE
jgi:hypothetical protein